MQASKSSRRRAFTLIELLTVIAVIGILAGMLLPALNHAREKGRRLACMANLHQIGIAMLAYASDYQNHTVTPDYNWDPAVSPSRPITWNYMLVDHGYLTVKSFQCPNDRRLPTVSNGATLSPCSYGMVVGQGNTSPTPPSGGGNYWIAGSRLTCPYLTNTAVAIVGEFLSDAVQPTVQQTGNDKNSKPFMTSPLDADQTFRPQSRHMPVNTLAGNYLYVDGHVEWNETLKNFITPPGQIMNDMFPAVPPGLAVPCP